MRHSFLDNLLSPILMAFGIGVLGAAAQAQPPGGPGAKDLKLVEKFDTDDDGILNAVERREAGAYLKEAPMQRRRRGGPGRGRGEMQAGTPGPKVAPADVQNFPDADLYDPTILRTFFLEFEGDDWEQELALFKPTDVEVPAKLTVDGKVYPNVGVSFRGASSFFRIQDGSKRSLNLSIDFVDKNQRLYGYKSLNLLNCSGDNSMMSSLLYSYISGQRIPTPKVNFVKVVINGESWGVYTSSQQFNKVFVKEHFDTEKGARWKVSGSPRGDGGLRYFGEDIEPYREHFEIKSKDKEKSWRALVNLCRILNETPDEKLEEALSPILDIEGVLWFLAVDISLLNSDGYWTRASDYSIYLDPNGKFHILPHDMNEAFRAGRGGPPRGSGGGFAGGFFGRSPGGLSGGGPPERGRGGPPQAGRFGGPPVSGGLELDPLQVSDPDRMPLRGRLLSNPKWRRQYLENVRAVARMMTWENLGVKVRQARELIEDEVAKDTRKLMSTEEFRAATSSDKPNGETSGLRTFAEQRSNYLLQHEKIRALGPG